MGKWLTSRIFIKSAIAQKNLKLCVMTTWTISIFPKNFCCHSNRKTAKITFDPYREVVYW